MCVCECDVICSEHLDLLFFFFSSFFRNFSLRVGNIFGSLFGGLFFTFCLPNFPWALFPFFFFLWISSQILRVMLNVLHHVCRSCFRARRKTENWWITTTTISRRLNRPPTPHRPLLRLMEKPPPPLTTSSGINGNSSSSNNRRSWLNWPPWRIRR